MADPQDMLSQAQDNSDSHSRENESLFGLSPKSERDTHDNLFADRQGFRQEIEIDELRTQLLLTQSDNRLLRQRMQV